MRKIIALSLTVVMLVCMTLCVFADGGFVDSVSINQAPELIGGGSLSEECPAELVITAYADRDELPEELRLQIEEAYRIILENEDLSVLNAKLREIAEELGVDVTALAVSDLFDIHYINCDDHEDHGHFDITLKAETLENFACLLHYYNGEFTIVEDAKVTGNGDHLEFTATEFSPFIIVTNTGTENDSPQTNDLLPIYLAVAAVSGLMIIGLAVAYKKERA